jgi:hypothetical protein
MFGAWNAPYPLPAVIVLVRVLVIVIEKSRNHEFVPIQK